MSFTAKSTSEEVISAFTTQAKGKYVVVTGGNVGLGKETVTSLALAGAHVTIACRTELSGLEVIDNIKSKHTDVDVSVIPLDLSDFVSIKAFADKYITTGKPLHILINNAGIMGCPLAYTKQGYESQFGVNHLGHFLLTNLLLPLLKQSGTAESPARVINISSLANLFFAPTEGIDFNNLKAEHSYNAWTKYGESKLSNILFSNELNRIMKQENQHVISMSLHPGFITNTSLARNLHMFQAFKLAFWLIFLMPRKSYR